MFSIGASGSSLGERRDTSIACSGPISTKLQTKIQNRISMFIHGFKHLISSKCLQTTPFKH